MFTLQKFIYIFGATTPLLTLKNLSMEKLLSVFAFSMALLTLISCSNEIEQPFDKPVDNPICDNEALIAVTALNARDFFFAPESRDASVSVDKLTI